MTLRNELITGIDAMFKLSLLESGAIGKTRLILNDPHLRLTPDLLFRACKENTQLIPLIIEAARNKNCLKQILNKRYYGLPIVEYLLQVKNFHALNALLEIENIHQYFNLNYLEYLTNQQFKNAPNKNTVEYHFFEKLKKLSKQHHFIGDGIESSYEYTQEEVFFNLFRKQFPTQIDTAPIAKKVAIAQFHALLSNPLECVKYLQFLNEEFLRYFREKHGEEFSELNANNYEFIEVDGLFYPVAKDNQEPFKKHHALEEFLICLFRKYGLAEKFYKWTGFVESSIASQMMKNGDFAEEDQQLLFSLVHGKLSHMLQLAILIYALEDGKINIHYGNENKLSLKDILATFIDEKDFLGAPLWLRTRDVRSYSDAVFSDPFRLTSTLMHEGKKLHLSALSDYLIHSFCKGIKKAIALSDKPKQSATSLLRSISAWSIANVSLTKIDFSKVKSNLRNIVKFGPSFFVTEKQYTLNSEFTPQMYSSQETLREKLENSILMFLNGQPSPKGNLSEYNSKIEFLIGLKSQIKFSTVPLSRIIKNHIKLYREIDQDDNSSEMNLLTNLMTMVANDCEALKHQSLFARSSNADRQEEIVNQQNMVTI